MNENKHTPVETFDCQGCRPYCYGGYHMEADKDGLVDYVKSEDYRAVEKQRDELQEEVNALKERAEYDLAEFARTLDISYDEINLLKKQRDELLAALEEALPMVPCGSFDAEKLGDLAAGGHQTAAMILRHRAAIASVKSGAA